jgi:hypothetical protein
MAKHANTVWAQVKHDAYQFGRVIYTEYHTRAMRFYKKKGLLTDDAKRSSALTAYGATAILIQNALDWIAGFKDEHAAQARLGAQDAAKAKLPRGFTMQQLIERGLN